ncbi:hypothetical protein [Streptomyces albipurpureus]|uniref:Uncharacterized protein n=1 Tax=Streptomyces albipurpureus TaxID=2897419 RepID=A0ABT0UHP4_9ACTN|nr:hypothetical protein [Streptomyces sp. CWNU-1]MCM2386831.1 hypothetical protein [Streptomyces sp. CWNU-1]
MQTWRDARARAESAATALQEALTQLGLPERAVGLIRPVVGPDGQAYVRVGLGLLESMAAESVAEGIRIQTADPEDS